MLLGRGKRLAEGELNITSPQGGCSSCVQPGAVALLGLVRSCRVISPAWASCTPVYRRKSMFPFIITDPVRNGVAATVVVGLNCDLRDIIITHVFFAG